MLSNKIVVVTGGAGLLGRSFCEHIVRNGGTAIIADLNMERATEIASELLRIQGSGLACAKHMDITNVSSISRVISELYSEFGRIDAVVNNAYPRNGSYGKKLEHVSYQDFCENLNLHLGGYFLVSQQFSEFFKKNSGGNVINMSSIYGVMTPRFEIYDSTDMTMPVEYAAIKASVVHLTKYFAKYYSRHGIRVNSISPGGVMVDQPQPFIEKYNKFCNSKGMLNPEDICGLLLFLLSDASKVITGQNFVVDDGFTL